MDYLTTRMAEVGCKKFGASRTGKGNSDETSIQAFRPVVRKLSEARDLTERLSKNHPQGKKYIAAIDKLINRISEES